MSDTKLIVPVVEVAQRTDPGRDPDKQINEDACRSGETEFGQLLVLCDGMGGHEGGREASNLAIESIFRHFGAAATRPDISPAVRARELLKEAIAVANRDVFALGTARAATRPGSTIVAVLLHAAGTDVAHVGDSRCYLVHEGQIRQLTRDHSMVQQLVDAGRLTPEQAAVHPEANKITRALGMSVKVDIELLRRAVVQDAGDVFVLCSDGLSDLVTADEIGHAIRGRSLQEAADQLVDLANARGGHDNISVMLLRAREPAVGPPAPLSERVKPTLTEPMLAVAPPSSGALPAAAPSERSRVAETERLIPPAPPIAPRRRSPWTAIGLGLGLIGVAAAGAVIALAVSPPKNNNDVPGMSLSVVLPAATFAPRVDDDEPDGAPRTDAGTRSHRFKKHKK